MVKSQPPINQMTEVKHTPGPWWSEGEYDEDECGCAIIAANTDCGPLPGNPTRGMVAWASELLPERADECIANARLIAAAPEMLEALKKARDALGANAARDDVDAAIAKAEGRS